MQPSEAEVEAVAEAYRAALAEERGTPTVADVNGRLAAVERTAHALERRLGRLDGLLGDGLDGLVLDLQDLQRRAAMALLRGRRVRRDDWLPPKTVLCVEALRLWHVHRTAPPTAYVKSPFFDFCADLYTSVTGECAEARGVGLIGHVKAALRHGRLSGADSPANFLNTPAEAVTLSGG